MTLDKLVRSFTWAIVLMFILALVTAVMALDYNNVSKSWYDGTVLRVAMGFYAFIMFFIFAWNIANYGSQCFPEGLLILALPIAFFVGIDDPPLPQGLIYGLMFLYFGIAIYWTLGQKERSTLER